MFREGCVAMKVYIVENREERRQWITKYVRQCLPEASIMHFVCVNDFLAYVRRYENVGMTDYPKEYWVISGMQMPLSSDSCTDFSAGYILLDRMGFYEFKCPVSIVSFEPIDEVRAKLSYKYYCGITEYFESA